MRTYFLGLILLSLLITCKTSVEKVSQTDILKKLISSNTEINNNFIKLFKKEGEKARIFKLIISRRDRFARITIYQIVDRNSIEDLPKGYFDYQKDLFIFYDGSELIQNQKIKQKDLDETLARFNIELRRSQYEIFHSPVLQFDINANNDIKFNFPAVNPYDLIEVPASSQWTK